MKKNTFFLLLEKKHEDAKQDEKHVPDLLESIMKAPGLVKEELRRILLKIDQIKSKIQKAWSQLFGFRKSEVFPPEANASLLAGRF